MDAFLNKNFKAIQFGVLGTVILFGLYTWFFDYFLNSWEGIFIYILHALAVLSLTIFYAVFYYSFWKKMPSGKSIFSFAVALVIYLLFIAKLAPFMAEIFSYDLEPLSYIWASLLDFVFLTVLFACITRNSTEESTKVLP